MRITFIAIIAVMLFTSRGDLNAQTQPASNPLAADVDRLSAEINPQVVAWRRDFHKNPELGNREVRTSKVIADELRKLGYEVRTNVATTGVIVAAMYLLPALQRVLFNPLDKPENEHLPDLSWREAAVLAPLLACIVWVGVYPRPLLRRMEPAAQRLVEQVRRDAGPVRGAAPGAAIADTARVRR